MAYITLRYYNMNLASGVEVTYDDASKTIVQGFLTTTGTFPTNGGLLHTDGDYKVYSRDLTPYAEVRYEKVSSPLSVGVSPTNPSFFGAADGKIILSVSGGSGKYTYSWSNGATTKDITGLVAGNYVVAVTDQGTGQVVNRSVELINPSGTQLKVTADVQHVSGPGATDGAIYLNVSGGSAPYTYEWYQDGLVIATSKDITRLGIGTYSVKVVDSGSQVVWLQWIEVALGGSGTVDEPYFLVPELNTLRFVHREGDDTSTQPGHRLSEEDHYGMQTGCNYEQKVQVSDVITTQIHSNYAELTLELRRYPEGTKLATYYPTMKLDDAPRELAVWGTLVQDTLAGKARVYPAGYEFPVELAAGGTIELRNSTKNGKYIVQQKSWDEAKDKPYLLINCSFLGTEPVTVVLIEKVRTYKVYEHTLPQQQPGRYELKVIAKQSNGTISEAISEPFEVAQSWPKTHLIHYKHSVAKGGMEYETGIMPAFRVESAFWEQLPDGEQELHRSGSQLIHLDSKNYRTYKFKTYLLPPWMHWKLSVVFTHEEVRINGLYYRGREIYAQPGYNPRAFLSGSSIILELIGKKAPGVRAGDRRILFANGVPVLMNGNFVLP